MKKGVFIIGISVIVILLLIGGLILSQGSKSPHSTATVTPTILPPQSITPKQEIPSTTPLPSTNAKNIIVTNPTSMQTVTLPITITGQARVFENQFNYQVLDVNNNIIREGTAYANSPDAGQYGNFSISIPSLPTMRANTITLLVFDRSAKDGSKRDEVKIPVVFDPSNSIPVNAYFGSNQTASSQECTTVYPLERHIAKTQAIARAALEELLKGPMTIEKNEGYYTSINDGVMIQKLVIDNGVAKVDFNKRLEEGIGGSCKVTFIRTQIIKTLEQFSSVKNVIISIDGRTEDILQP